MCERLNKKQSTLGSGYRQGSGKSYMSAFTVLPFIKYQRVQELKQENSDLYKSQQSHSVEFIP